MKLIFLYFSLVAIAACGLSAEHTHTASLEEEKPSGPICFVLCDMSASQGEASRQTIIHNAKAIFKNARGYTFKYYDISGAPLEKPFFHYQAKPSTLISKRTDRDDREKEFSIQEDTLHENLKRLYEMPSAYSTCIIRTIEKVVNTLANQAPGNLENKIKIVILSDMLEDCSYDYGKIDIDHGSFQAALSTLSKMPPPKFTLSGYKNIEVCIVAASQRHINTDALYSFWVEVLKKYGYHLNKPIAVDLPKWVTD